MLLLIEYLELGKGLSDGKKKWDILLRGSDRRPGLVLGCLRSLLRGQCE